MFGRFPKFIELNEIKDDLNSYVKIVAQINVIWV